MRRVLVPVLALSFLGLHEPARGDDPSWRESRGDAKQDAYWRSIEGQPMRDLVPAEALSEWTNTAALTWDDLKGKVVLVDMWATWCGPCIAGIPHLVQMHQKYSDKGLVILGVHVDGGWERMAQFAKQNPVPYALAAEKTGVVSRKLMVNSIPCYFVADREGILRVACANRGKLDQIIEHYLAQQPAGDGSAKPAATYPPAPPKRLYAANDLRGKPAPRLEVERWLGDEPDTKGKAVLIDFWATWCGPCRELIPHLNALAEKFADRLVIVGVSGEEPEVVERFMGEHEIKYALGVDRQQRMSRALGIEGVPHVLIVSSDGVVRWQGFPGEPTDRLTEGVVRRILEADAGPGKNADEPAPAAAPGE